MGQFVESNEERGAGAVPDERGQILCLLQRRLSSRPMGALIAIEQVASLSDDAVEDAIEVGLARPVAKEKDILRLNPASMKESIYCDGRSLNHDVGLSGSLGQSFECVSSGHGNRFSGRIGPAAPCFLVHIDRSDLKDSPHNRGKETARRKLRRRAIPEN